jgi:hypothetical protein
MNSQRVVILSAEAGSLDQLLGAPLPDKRDVFVVTWDRPEGSVRSMLENATVVVVGEEPPPRAEAFLLQVGGGVAQRVLRRTPVGRLIDSFSLLHRSRQFAARVKTLDGWHPRSGDAIIALDNSAALLAWRTVRTVSGTTATLGVAAGLQRLEGVR